MHLCQRCLALQEHPPGPRPQRRTPHTLVQQSSRSWTPGPQRHLQRRQANTVTGKAGKANTGNAGAERQPCTLLDQDPQFFGFLCTVSFLHHECIAAIYISWVHDSERRLVMVVGSRLGVEGVRCLWQMVMQAALASLAKNKAQAGKQ